MIDANSIPCYVHARLNRVLNPPVDVHKYSRGVAQLCAGSPEYAGAALLCARAAQRAGAGYTQLFTDASIESLQVASPSLVVRSLDAWEMPDHNTCALGIGSGFSPGDFHTTHCTLFERTQWYPHCIVVDGGALSFLATEQGKQWAAVRARSGFPTIITPHLGEAARLLASISDDVSGDMRSNEANKHHVLNAHTPQCSQPHLSHNPHARTFEQDVSKPQASANCTLEQDAYRLSQHFSCCVCLKSSNTVIAYQNSIATLTNGGVELAKAGTGDVLMGVITALCSQQLAPFDAALSGAYLHALAGKFAAEQGDMVSVIPEDIIAALPRVFTYVRSFHE